LFDFYIHFSISFTTTTTTSSVMASFFERFELVRLFMRAADPEDKRVIDQSVRRGAIMSSVGGGVGIVAARVLCK
jgi:hypothetical protein